MSRNVPVVYLRAGEMHCTDEPSLVITVLGSCLSVTMYSPALRIGGICHGLLPVCEHSAGCSKPCPEGLRYVECSIRRMAELFDRAGAKRADIEVKCFGGADMFARKPDRRGAETVGRQNIRAAERTLKREGFRIAREDVGGLLGRKIFFYTYTGEVLLKRLTRMCGAEEA